MFPGLGNKLLFPAPNPSYRHDSYRRHLCHIPWNEQLRKGSDEQTCGTAGVPCLWFPAQRAATVLLFFHANAEDLGMCFSLLQHMRDQFKVNVLAPEYPGYGLLAKMPPSEDLLNHLALTVCRYLVDEMQVRYPQIVLCGRSLGSGPAVHLAAKFPVGGLILISPFASVKAAVRSIAGRVMALGFDDAFPNDKIIANVTCPTLFIHGEKDSLLPPEHSVRLFTKCRARKLLVSPPRMEHNSNLFSQASYLALPVIHFFGFPGFYTDKPPKMPASLFDVVSAEVPNVGASGWLTQCVNGRDLCSRDFSDKLVDEIGPPSHSPGQFSMAISKEGEFTEDLTEVRMFDRGTV